MKKIYCDICGGEIQTPATVRVLIQYVYRDKEFYKKDKQYRFQHLKQVSFGRDKDICLKCAQKLAEKLARQIESTFKSPFLR